MNEIELSKFISLILRHKPEIINIKLDDNGWADVEVLINGINKKDFNINMGILERIVETNNKQRFAFNDNKTKIRANQGHSIAVDVELEELIPPDILYHGTSKRFLENILKDGITKQNRNHVHLSANVDTALIVGKRHGNPIVLKINSKQMSNDGIKFYKSKNNVWLTDYVNSKYFINYLL
ncbi:RNA 2'-phosphotransferase [Mycoplasmatota bacterium]|nr:RNA 2'-phosphotransferase [Mycoplasmatota bacterium]